MRRVSGSYVFTGTVILKSPSFPSKPLAMGCCVLPAYSVDAYAVLTGEMEAKEFL
jgi:hypothetical protein